jgi:hypothetical protein
MPRNQPELLTVTLDFALARRLTDNPVNWYWVDKEELARELEKAISQQENAFHS